VEYGITISQLVIIIKLSSLFSCELQDPGDALLQHGANVFITAWASAFASAIFCGAVGLFL
jgi:hypothetical protein